MKVYWLACPREGCVGTVLTGTTVCSICQWCGARYYALVRTPREAARIDGAAEYGQIEYVRAGGVE